MPTYLKPSYPNLDAIPEAQRDFYVLNTAKSVYELAQQGDEIAKYYNRELAANRDEFRAEKDRLKVETERQGREITRLTDSNTRLHDAREADVTRLTKERDEAETKLRTATTEGNVVVTKEEAALFEKFKKLGKPEDVAANKLDAIYTDVETRLKDTDALRTESEQHKRDEVTRDAAGLLDWNFKTLRDVQRHPDYGKDIEIVIENVKDGDEQVPTPYVKFKKDGKDEKLELNEYADAHWQIWLPALTADASSSGERERGTKLVHQKPSSTRTGNETKKGDKRIEDKLK